MSIANTSNRWLNRLYKTVAILLVLLAVLISAFRLLSPYVKNYPIDFQNYLNNRYQTNIVIGSLGIAWQGTRPTIVLGNVSLVDNEKASLYINQLTLQVDFWRSISQQKLISSNSVLTGAKVNVSEGLWQKQTASASSTKNRLQDNNLKNNKATNDFELVANVFLNRLNQFTIRDSHIVINNETLTRGFHINNLTWLNKGDLHQAQGSVVFNGLSSNNLQLRLKLKGDNISELNGQVYLEGNHLDITPWLDSLLAIDNDETKTDISFATWLTVNNSSVERLQVELAENNISWLFENVQQNLTLGQGQLLLVKGKQKKSLKLFSTPLPLKFNQQSPQNLTFMLNKKASNYSAYISTIDLSLASQLVPLFVGEKTNLELLAKLSLTGKVSDLHIRNQPLEDVAVNKRQDKNRVQVVATFANVSNSYSHGIPGITNLSGRLSLNDNYLTLDVLAQQGDLNFNKHFVQPFPYQTLSAKANILFNDAGWSLAVNELDFVSEQIQVSAQVQLEAPVNSEMTMALLATMEKGNAGNVGHYLPLSIMSKSLVGYLNNALVSGTIKQAQVLLNGPLAKFPFTDNSGVFVVDAELTGSTFKFSENWPAITDFSANLNFTNNSMLITGREGDLTGINVSGVEVAIDDLADKQILTVDALIKPTKAKAVAKLMQNSPLKDSIGSVLGHLNVSGNITGKFDLNLPLNDLDNTIASGEINFNDNQVALQAPRMNFSEVEGQLRFVNDVIETDSLALVWQGLPLFLEIAGIDKNEYYDTDINLSANWAEQEWQQHVPLALQKYLQNKLSWQGDLSLHQHHQGGFSYDFTLDSDLFSTTLNLPAPYGKKAQEKNDFTINVNGQMQQSKITAQLDDNLRFFGVLNHKDTQFSRAHLVLGDEKMLLPMDGFHITTQLEQADFSLWQPLLSDIISSIAVDPNEVELTRGQAITSNQESPLFAKPERIRGSIGQLSILGQELNNVSFNLLDKQHWWLLQLNAKETRSQLKFYPDWFEQGVDINAEFIHLGKNENGNEGGSVRDEKSALTASKSKPINETTPLVDEKIIEKMQHNLSSKAKKVFDNNDTIFASIPPFKLHCDRCQIGSLNLGQVDFTVERSGDDMIKINHFKAVREQARLGFSAIWLKNNELSQTSLSGEMSLNNIEYELKQLGFDSIVRDSGGEVDFNLDWNGGPHEVDLANLNGAFQAKLDDGYLTEVSDVARVFSVLSLESLVRKLTLDFRDIFSDGMFYSDIEGDFKVEQGLLSTTNTKMNGTAGNLSMKGSTNFVSGALDYKLSYKPNLSSSLPALAWIATLNPVTFLAGIAIDQVIKSQVVSEINFTLTGTVIEPNFQQVSQEKKNISVSGSSAPELSDSATEPTPKDKKAPIKHLEQYKKKQKKVSHELLIKEVIDG